MRKAGIFLMAFVLAGCGPSLEARRQDTVRELRSAGFVTVPQKDYVRDPRFVALKPYVLHEVPVRSGSVYFYPDPDSGRALVGGAREVEVYRKLQTAKRTGWTREAAQSVATGERAR
jgi:hypothetical protein